MNRLKKISDRLYQTTSLLFQLQESLGIVS